MTNDKILILHNLKIHSRKMEGELLDLAIDKNYHSGENEMHQLLSINTSLIHCMGYVAKFKEK